MNDTNELNEHTCCNRRSVLKTVFGVTVAGIVGGVGLGIPSISYAAALTREERDKLTPDQIIAGMKKGNERFRTENCTSIITWLKKLRAQPDSFLQLLS